MLAYATQRRAQAVMPRLSCALVALIIVVIHQICSARQSKQTIGQADGRGKERSNGAWQQTRECALRAQARARARARSAVTRSLAA